MRRDQLVAFLALSAVVLFLGYTVVTRMHDGRRHSRPGWGRSMSALDCTLPPAPAGGTRP